MKINLFSEKQVQKIKRFVSETSKESDEKVDKRYKKGGRKQCQKIRWNIRKINPATERSAHITDL